MIVELDELKKHLNIDEDFEDDDDYIESLEAVAEEIVARMIDTHSIEIEVTPEEGDPEKIRTWDLEVYFSDGVPATIKQALKFWVADLYNHRESTTDLGVHDVPRTLEYLVNQYTNPSF